MDCQTYQSRFDDFVAERLSAEEQFACEQHMTSCLYCLDLWSSHCVQATQQDREQLLSKVMDTTSANPCAECEDVLAEYLDELLGHTGNSLVTAHLETCDSCRGTAAAMRTLSQDLPTLARVEPPVDLLERILSRTLPWHSRLARRIPYWSDAVLQVFIRPRFALEASFIGTMILLVTFGIPVRLTNAVPADPPVIPTVVPAIVSAMGIELDNLQRAFDIQPLLAGGISAINSFSVTLVQSGISAVGNLTQQMIQPLSGSMENLNLDQMPDGEELFETNKRN